MLDLDHYLLPEVFCSGVDIIELRMRRAYFVL